MPLRGTRPAKAGAYFVNCTSSDPSGRDKVKAS